MQKPTEQPAQTEIQIAETVTDAEQLAAMTIRSVDQITETAARALEKRADDFELEAHDRAERLRRFAQAIRENGAKATTSLTDTLDQQTKVIEAMQALAPAAENGAAPTDGTAPADRKDPIPKFLRKGPAIGDTYTPPIVHGKPFDPFNGKPAQ
jgi:hypothetical protein